MILTMKRHCTSSVRVPVQSAGCPITHSDSFPGVPTDSEDLNLEQKLDDSDDEDEDPLAIADSEVCQGEMGDRSPTSSEPAKEVQEELGDQSPTSAEPAKEVQEDLQEFSAVELSDINDFKLARANLDKHLSYGAGGIDELTGKTYRARKGNARPSHISPILA